jgi:aspartyl-tRNA(Asn)/glutamyl-tRNA(Gln) amidotransferase subunit A
MKHVQPQQLWQLSASELAAAYRAGMTTPDAVLQAVLGRIEDVNPRLNAIITLDIPGAREAANASSARWRAGQPLGPLDGVPVTVKDNILVKGLRATWGSRLYADYVPDKDEEPVARLRDAGAVILGKTNVPEFTLHGTTDNRLFGPTGNPWNPALTPGGSSGGAVAAVASGIGPLALCTDGGGSIRRPAAHTGLVGFKPSRGMVPRANGFPAILHDFEVAGPIARNVDDIILAMNAIAGESWRQPDTSSAEKPLRILYVPTFSGAPVDSDIAGAVADVAAELQRQGHDVEQDENFDLAAPIADIWPVISQTGLAWLLSQFDNAENKISPALAEMARNGQKYSAADYLNALDTIKHVDRDFDALFASFDLLLTPATAAMPWAATETHPTTIAGQPVGPRGHAVFTPFANALGLPAISLPCKSWPQHMPIGFQLCAAHDRDAALLAFARDHEKRTGWQVRWPALDL